MKYPTTAILSSCGAFVAPRTMAGPNSSHSLKAAESAARYGHTREGLARLLGPSRGLWRVISGFYGLRKNRSRANGKHHKPEAVESITNCHRKKASQTIGHGEQRLTPQSILYCNYRQSVINSLLLTLARRNQFFILNNDKVQLIVDCYLRQSVINSLFFIASKWD